MPLSFATATDTAIPFHVVPEGGLKAYLADLPDRHRAWAEASRFSGEPGSVLLLPDDAGGVAAAALGYGTPAKRARTRFTLAAAAARLPAGTYVCTGGWPKDESGAEALGWLLTGYAFRRYRPGGDNGVAGLVAPEGVDAARIEALARAEHLTRDLINTPTSDMGPSALEAAIRDLAAEFGANVTSVVGDDLLVQNFPMIHAVGRAAADSPRLIDMRWGDSGPALTLVGKGVCFDTGGLNLKPGASMGTMKKDMGGAANVLGLARMIMATGLPLRLRVLVPAVENAVSGNAFRPQDILTSRKGLTVEINNTDAEGRLVLADALALADETPPDFMVSMATLTGAARVAVGPDLAPYFTDDASVAAAFDAAARPMADPVWRLPFWEPYETRLDPGIADLDNAPKGLGAGAITAALFLRRFVTDTPRYAHFDIFGWQPSAEPGRSKGGFGQGARAVFHALPELLGL